MSKVNDLLFNRLRQKFSKMNELAEISSKGNLSSFAGVFKVSPLTPQEKQALETLLNDYKNDADYSVSSDLTTLSGLTSEIKAINNQAAILHGERIQKAQDILKKYRDGAFSAWLNNTYGNRQTPYNFLQYYEFYLQLPQALHLKLDEMPRQAIYTLASRDVPFEQKEEILKNYNGETKNEVLTLIRKTFPLDDRDGRRENLGEQAVIALKKLEELFTQKRFRPTDEQKVEIQALLSSLSQHLLS